MSDRRRGRSPRRAAPRDPAAPPKVAPVPETAAEFQSESQSQSGPKLKPASVSASVSAPPAPPRRSPIDPAVLGSRIKAARRRAKLTQKGLAARAGLLQQKISLYELGRQPPSLETLRLIRDAIGCPIADLVPEFQSDDGPPIP